MENIRTSNVYFEILKNLNKISFKFPYLFLVIIIFSIGLSGCVTFNDPESSQVYTADLLSTLKPDSSVGQSFSSRRPRLNGITVWLTIAPSQPGSSSTNPETIRVELFHSISDPEPIFSTSISPPSSGNNIPIYIKILTQENIPDQNFYIELSSNSNTIQINGRNEDAYPHGQLYIDKQPMDADIAFRLTYDYDLMAMLQDFLESFSQYWLILPLFAVLFLPGWLLLELSGKQYLFDFGEWIALSLGLSLSIIPVFMLWSTIFRIRLTRPSVFIITLVLTLLLLTRLVLKAFFFIKSLSNQAQTSRDKLSYLFGAVNFDASILALLIIFGLTLAIRLIMVRDLATPAWVDSTHHALITRLIMTQGGYPATFSPYISIQSSSYHIGFHSIVAIFTWLSNLDISSSLLILGQILNALSVFSVYLFTKSLTNRSSAAVISALITGFFTPMPAYYTSWSRYTELTGLLILPAAFALIISIKNYNDKYERILRIILGAIASAGLFIVHLRVIFFFAFLILSYFLIYIFRKSPQSTPRWRYTFINITIAAVLAGVIVLPVLLQTASKSVVPLVKSATAKSFPPLDDFSWAFLTAAMGKQALILAGLGLIWGIIKSKRFTLMILIWIASLFLATNLSLLRLREAGLVTNSSIEIMLFIPISVLGGYFVDQLIQRWSHLFPSIYRVPINMLITAIFIPILIIGSKQLVTIINPITILTRNADLPAINWLKEHIPEEETVVINSFAWGYGNFAGSDGGSWISPLTGIKTIPPPVLYGLGSDRLSINEQCQQIINLSSNPAKLGEYMENNGYRYIFNGQKGGPIPPEKLVQSGLFEAIYHKDGVWIISLKP